MINKEPISPKQIMLQELYKRYGSVQRTRGCYLYTKSGIRLTDMYQENSKAILGWRYGKAQLAFKNSLERGVIGSLPTELDAALIRSCRSILPENFSNAKIVWLLDSPTNLIRKLQSEFSWKKSTPHECSDFDYTTNPKIDIWRPWINNNFQSSPVLVFNTFFPWATDISIVAVNHEIECSIKSDLIPAPLQAAITRSFYDLQIEIEKRRDESFCIHNKTLKLYFERNGAWFFPIIKKESYHSFFCHCLDSHILISPDFNEPSIFPWQSTPGDFRLLKNNIFEN